MASTSPLIGGGACFWWQQQNRAILAAVRGKALIIVTLKIENSVFIFGSRSTAFQTDRVDRRNPTRGIGARLSKYSPQRGDGC